jgi:hypothetical protein
VPTVVRDGVPHAVNVEASVTALIIDINRRCFIISSGELDHVAYSNEAGGTSTAKTTETASSKKLVSSRTVGTIVEMQSFDCRLLAGVPVQDFPQEAGPREETKWLSKGKQRQATAGQEEKSMMQGSCMCGGVRYEYEGAFGTITVCHCSDCRKAQGGGGVIAAPVEKEKFRWTQGEDLIQEYESSPGKKRAFCRSCGTPLYSRRDAEPAVLRLRMGSLDSEVDATPAAHIFTLDVPEWAAINDNLPHYDTHEPGRINVSE